MSRKKEKINSAEQELYVNTEHIEDTQGVNAYKEYINKIIQDKSEQVKGAGEQELNHVMRTYKLSQEDIATTEEQTGVYAKLKIIIDAIDKLTQSTQQAISEVGGDKTKESDVERKQIIEQFQQERGNVLTDMLTSEVVSNGLNLVPFAGGGKMLVESIAGKEFSGHKLTGKERIIHGAIAVGSLALDLTGIGETMKAGIIAGKSVGLIEKLGYQLASKGSVKSARIFEKTGEFMVKHPKITSSAEKYADKKIKKAVKEIKRYQKEDRAESVA